MGLQERAAEEKNAMRWYPLVGITFNGELV